MDPSSRAEPALKDLSAKRTQDVYRVMNVGWGCTWW